MKLYPEGTMMGVFILGLCTGVIVAGITALTISGPPIDPQLLRVAEHVCRNNEGPKLISPRREDRYDIRCVDTALFQSVEAKFTSVVRVAGAQLGQ